MITASSDVSNRLEFFSAPELMVFDAEASRMVGERTHLHLILESELWVFGVRFNLVVSEAGLTAVLERHRELLGKHPLTSHR